MEARIGGAEEATTDRELTARRVGGDERATSQSLARLGAVTALYGLLSKVRDLDLPLISVTRVKPDQAGGSSVKP